MASFTITPLTDHTGGDVVGIDGTRHIDSDKKYVFDEYFAKYHVPVMRERNFTPEEFKRAATVFGELQRNDKREHHVPGRPGLYYVSNDVIRNRKRIIPGKPCHTDHANHPVPAKATTLYTVPLPIRSGDKHCGMNERRYPFRLMLKGEVGISAA